MCIFDHIFSNFVYLFQNCPIGQYSFAGSSSCMMCPGGKMCTNGTNPIVPPIQCVTGTYSPPGDGRCRECASSE